MKKASAKLVPKNLTPDQKLVHQQICSDFLVRLDEEPELMENSSLVMKPGYSNTMLKLSGNLCTTMLLYHQQWKKARMSKSKFKAMLIVFSTSRHRDYWMGSRGSNFKSNLLFQSFGNTARASSLDIVGKKLWILHQENAPAHTALSVKNYLATKGTPVLKHVLYLPNLAPCDFFQKPSLL